MWERRESCGKRELLIMEDAKESSAAGALIRKPKGLFRIGILFTILSLNLGGKITICGIRLLTSTRYREYCSSKLRWRDEVSKPSSRKGRIGRGDRFGRQ